MTMPQQQSVGTEHRHAGWYVGAMEHFIDVAQDLSHARGLDEIMKIVRDAARELTGADGATFVLRDGDNCYYADENAVAPLWKGQRFPMSKCISGWVMKHGETVFIEDIYKDERIPADAYRPTFVKSLLMVPIRKDAPIGAIGTYWARNRRPAPEEIAILEQLANMTSVAMENVALYTQLQHKVEALEESNDDLNRFAWIASHDLKSPLRSIDHLSAWIEEDANPVLSPESRQHLLTLRQRVRRMERLLEDLLSYAQIENKMGMTQTSLLDADDLIAESVAILEMPAGFTVHVMADDLPKDLPCMPLQLVFSNLIGNAIKHHDAEIGHIWVDCRDNETHYIFSIVDDGPGIPPEHRESVFDMFRTLRPRDEVEGSGMGLAFVRKILDLNGGTIGVTARNDNQRGAAFHFTWPKQRKGPAS